MTTKLVPRRRISIAVCLSAVLMAQTGRPAPFKDGERVVFFGDSIIHGGLYGEYVNLFYATRYPERSIWFSNSGWSGASAQQGLWSIEEDIVAKKPTIVTVMFGMNDINRNAWPRTNDTPSLAAMREGAIRTYDERMTELVRRVRAEAGNPEIIYFTPSPYDQTCIVDGKPSDIVCNDGLAILADHVRSWAVRDRATCVDFQNAMLAINAAMQIKDPSASLLRSSPTVFDRVHPGPLGHTIMLYEILKAQGAEGLVDKIERDANGADALAFSCTEKSLPFPMTAEMRDALALVPFERDFNREILCVRNLKEGRYAVNIDGVDVGSWTAAELAEGVNLALNDKTPQYRQAAEVAKICQRLWEGERMLRDFATRRRWMKMHYKVDPDAPGAVEGVLDKLLANGMGEDSYAVRTYRAYLKNWPRHAEFESAVVKDRAALAESVRPKEHRFEFMTVLRPVSAFGAVGQESAYSQNGLVAAKEVRARDGIGNVLAKLRSGVPVKIAYFGGSITAMDGWRRLSREWLKSRYPDCAIDEIAAAIGGTGSGLGVYRYGQDVLDKNPDLVFVEFATNDSGAKPEDIWRNFDGIVLQTWKRNPKTDIVFVYTITAPMMSDYGNGFCNRAASAMERVADHYGIPSICFGPRVAAEAKAGRLVMSMKELETAVPKEAPDRDERINAELKKGGKTLFARDGVHPALPGHGLYLESIKAAWDEFEKMEQSAANERHPKPFFDSAMENAKMVAIDPSMLSGKWDRVGKDDPNGRFASRFGCLPWVTTTPGSKLSFKFRGTNCKIYDLLGPACGQLWVTVDGKRRAAPVARFDSYCTYYRLADFVVYSGEDGVHSVEIELDSKQPSRQPVAFRLKDPEKELAAPKFNGTEWFPGRIMLVGDVEENCADPWGSGGLAGKRCDAPRKAKCLELDRKTKME